jgi:PAS domain S-box-containing protein
MTQVADLDGPITTLVHYSPIATVITNPRLADNPIVAVNVPFIELTGYGEDEILGRNCRFLSGPQTEPWLTERIKTAVENRKPVLVEILNYKKDGTPFRNALVVAPIYDDEGELEYFLGSQVELDEESEGSSSSRSRGARRQIETLSTRQREVLTLMAKGKLNKQIAYDLGLSEKTIKMHRALLIAKLEVSTSADAVRIAVEAGL